MEQYIPKSALVSEIERLRDGALIRPFQTIQTRRVSHRFYNSHKVGSKWTGKSPHLFMYDR